MTRAGPRLITYKHMWLYSSMWQKRLALVAMEVTQQARECTKTETEADDVCGQDKPDNNGLCRGSEKEREHSDRPELRCW